MTSEPMKCAPVARAQCCQLLAGNQRNYPLKSSVTRNGVEAGDVVAFVYAGVKQEPSSSPSSPLEATSPGSVVLRTRAKERVLLLKDSLNRVAGPFQFVLGVTMCTATGPGSMPVPLNRFQMLQTTHLSILQSIHRIGIIIFPTLIAGGNFCAHANARYH
ncbi:hypothetical protein CBL_03432 [Carabus blaptoides fortunei]